MPSSDLPLAINDAAHVDDHRTARIYLVQCAALALAYFCLAVFGIYLTKQPGSVAAIWWPNALVLGVLLRTSFKQRWGLLAADLIANFCANYAMSYDILHSLTFGASDLLEILVSLSLLSRISRPLNPCTNVLDFVLVIAIILGAGAVASASFVTLLIGLQGATGLGKTWVSWWMAECIGMLSLLPVGLSASRQALKQLFVGNAKFEFFTTTLVSLLTTWLSLSFTPFPFVFLGIPLLLASLRQPLLGTALIGLANVVLVLVLQLDPQLAAAAIHPTVARYHVLLATALALIGPLLVAVQTAQRKRVLRHLRESERTLRDAMEYSSIGIALVAGDGRWIKVNPALCELVGYSAHELRALTFQDLTYPDDLATDLELKNRVIAGDLTHYTMEKRYVRKNGDVIWANLAVAGVYDADNEFLNFVSQIENIDDRKRAELQRETLQRELEHRARHDALTGLINREAFEIEARQLLDGSKEQQHVACFLDLDRFKILNDSAGHAAGDLFLREIATRLTGKIRAHDVLARLGGDEFGLLLPDCPLEPATRIAQGLIDTINSTHFTWNGRVFEIGASIGIVPFSAGSMTFAELLSRADVACYTAKNEGRNRVVVYSGNDSDAARDHHQIQLAASIREALEREQFCLYSQQIVPLDPSNTKKAFELLVRLRTDDGQIVLPGAFIAAAERYGWMPRIDRWVIHKALIEHGPALAHIDNLSLSINLSGTSFNDPQFADFLQKTLRQSPIPTNCICFEVTETALINHISAAADLIRLIQAEGCAVALDDFGSGLSSFNYLKNFAVQFVKIDGSFVRAMSESAIDRAIVESINQIAHRLGAATIAEYVENLDIAARLRVIGVDYAQGYAFAQPIPIGEMLKQRADGAEIAEPTLSA